MCERQRIDEELIEEFYSCKDESLDQLWDYYGPKLATWIGKTFATWIRSASGDEHETKASGDEIDSELLNGIVASVFVKVMNTKLKNRYDKTKGNFSTWIYRIARNVAYSTLKKLGREPVKFSVLIGPKGDLVDFLDGFVAESPMGEREQTIAIDRRDDVHHCLQQLEVNQRLVMLLKFADPTVTYDSLGQILGISTTGAYHIFHRSVDNLRRCLEVNEG